MKAAQAYKSRIELEATCASITSRQWNKWMAGAVKANGSKIRAMIKKQLPDLYEALGLDFWNPWEHQCKRTKRHLIYVHSAIEYFLKLY